VPQIEVTFDIDANGILSVNAKDSATSKEQSIRIEGSGGLSKDEIERMVREADAHASEDQERREKIEKRNALDSLVYNAEKTIRESGDKIPEEEKKQIDEVLQGAKADLESDDLARIDAANQRVEQAMHKIAEVLYKSQSTESGEAAQGDAESPQSGEDGDVIDAEYTEEKG
jgi:molecular chaperone DnaK